ncbi:MAG: ParB N-terminal domain-containing protein [Planctomycetota bacterium]
MEYHEAANIFPLSEDDELDALADDIRQHGLQVPVETLDGKIIDGRRRWLACIIAGVQPDVVEVDPDDPVAYVLSLNVDRRHLNESQRAMVGDAARDYYAEQAKERQKEHAGTAPESLSGVGVMADTPDKWPRTYGTDT